MEKNNSSKSGSSSNVNSTILEENYTYNIYDEVNLDEDIDRSIPNLEQNIERSISIPFIRRMTSKDRL